MRISTAPFFEGVYDDNNEEHHECRMHDACRHDHGVLMAMFIGVQNLPEGFNAYLETAGASIRPCAVLLSLLAVSLLGPAFACIGYFFFQEETKLTAGIMVFTSGGHYVSDFLGYCSASEDEKTLDSNARRSSGICRWNGWETGDRMN